MTDPNDPVVKKRRRRWDATLVKICVFTLISRYPLTGMTTFYMCGFTNCMDQPHNTGAGSHGIIMLTLLSTATLLVASIFLLTLTRIAIGRRRFYSTLSCLKRKAQSIFTRRRPAPSKQS